MFSRQLYPLLIAVAAFAQAPSEQMAMPELPIHPSMAGVPPESVIATVDGRKITAGELGRLFSAIPQLADNFSRNKKEFLRSYGFGRRAAALAEKNGMEKLSPYKERLEHSKTVVLMQAQLDAKANQIVIQLDDQKKYYKENADKYGQITARVIYIAFNNNPAPTANPKPLNETQAKAKAEGLAKQLRAGADFVEFVRKYSEEPGTKAQDGLLTGVKRADVPENVRNVLFAAKKGTITDPLRQPNGFYIFRIDDVKAQPFEEVRDEIYKEIKTARLNQWIDEIRNGVEIKIENEALFENKTPSPRPLQ